MLAPPLLLPALLLVPVFGVLVSVGVVAADVELPPPLLSVDPVATAASADTTTVDVLLGCGLFEAG